MSLNQKRKTKFSFSLVCQPTLMSIAQDKPLNENDSVTSMYWPEKEGARKLNEQKTSLFISIKILEPGTRYHARCEWYSLIAPICTGL